MDRRTQDIVRISGREAALVILGTTAVMSFWLLAAALSDSPTRSALPFVFAQTGLAALLFALLAAGSRRWKETGPETWAFLAIHSLVFYGIANVVPVFFRLLRPAGMRALLESRVPVAGVDAYTAATIAAIGLVGGAAVGSEIASRLTPLPARATAQPWRVRWLPGAAVSAACLAVLVVLVLAGTARFGLGFGVTLTDEEILRFGLTDKLLFHGLLSFLPLGPALAAAVYIQSRRTGILGAALLLSTSVFFVAMVAVWRMRSTAMVATLLPVAFLAIAGKLDIRRWLSPMCILLAGVYAAVTAVRVSDVSNIVKTGQEENVRAADLLDALGRQSGDQSVLGRTLIDASYRTAGLEAVAAIVEAQDEGRLRIQGLRVTSAGFLQALPMALRSEPDYPLQAKKAPSTLGIFGEGDWVTTLLAEGVLDFGAWGTVLYGLVAGFLIGLLERMFLLFGSIPVFDVLLVFRYAFLVYLLIIAADLSSMTFLFLKATVGFLVLLMLASLLVNSLRAALRGPPGVSARRDPRP